MISLKKSVYSSLSLEIDCLVPIPLLFLNIKGITEINYFTEAAMLEIGL